MPSLPVVLHSRCAPILCSRAIFYLYHTRLKPDVHIRMVRHLFQNYDTIYVRFFPRILAIIPATRYTCVFLSRILTFYSQVYDHFLTNAHIYAHKKVHIQCICVTNKHVVYAVAESRRIRGTELYHQQKAPSCTAELESNFSLSQAWPQCPR